jgi:hypothetical protein
VRKLTGGCGAEVLGVDLSRSPAAGARSTSTSSFPPKAVTPRSRRYARKRTRPATSAGAGTPITPTIRCRQWARSWFGADAAARPSTSMPTAHGSGLRVVPGTALARAWDHDGPRPADPSPPNIQPTVQPGAGLVLVLAMTVVRTSTRQSIRRAQVVTETSRSLVSSTSTPCARHRAAMRASCTMEPRTRGWRIVGRMTSTKFSFSISNESVGDCSRLRSVSRPDLGCWHRPSRCGDW